MDQQTDVQPETVPGQDAPVRQDLKPERIQQALKRVPAWRLSRDGKAIESTRLFVDGQAASAFARYACRMAGMMGQPLKVHLAGKRVLVTLTGHPVRGCTGGLTDPVFRTADLIGN
jgi:pterin-4a-carbinolamine dehydratase